MAKLFYDKRTITSSSATTEASGYPASNAALESITRPWRSTTLVEHTYTQNMASATAAAVIITDGNFASCTVKNAANATLGTITTNVDKLTGRRRGILVATIAATTAIKLVIPAGTPTDGAAYFKVGSMYVFGSSSTLPKSPGMGTKVRAIFPAVRADLPNGQVAQAAIGSDILVLSMPFIREYSQDGLEILRRARVGTVGLDIEHTDYPELVLPVRYFGGAQEEDFFNLQVTQTTLELREVV